MTAPKRHAATRDSGLRVLYEDNHCLAVYKPAGLLTIGDRTDDVSLVDLARDDLRKRYGKPGNVFVGVVHRLDRPVSGVVLLARTSKAAGRLAEQFRGGRVEKVYEALVEGRVAARVGTLFDRLVKDRQKNVVRSVAPSTPQARECLLTFRRLKALRNNAVGGETPNGAKPSNPRPVGCCRSSDRGRSKIRREAAFPQWDRAAGRATDIRTSGPQGSRDNRRASTLADTGMISAVGPSGENLLHLIGMKAKH